MTYWCQVYFVRIRQQLMALLAFINHTKENVLAIVGLVKGKGAALVSPALG